MTIFLCSECRLNGYCRRIVAPVVSDDQLKSPEYIRDLRNFAASRGVTAESWLDHLADLYRDYPGWIIGPDGQEELLDLEQFERPHIREWFRDFCNGVCPPDVTPRVRVEARERVRILATILAARYPVDAMLWGVRPANDNRAPVADN